MGYESLHIMELLSMKYLQVDSVIPILSAAVSHLFMHHSKAHLCTISNTNPSSETRRGTKSGNFSRGSPTISSSLASSSWESFSQEVQTQNYTQQLTDTHSKWTNLKRESSRLRKKEKTRSKAQITERKAKAK